MDDAKRRWKVEGDFQADAASLAVAFCHLLRCGAFCLGTSKFDTRGHCDVVVCGSEFSYGILGNGNHYHLLGGICLL